MAILTVHPSYYFCVYSTSFHTLTNTYMMYLYIQEGESALMMAVRRGKTGVIKELVETGADLNLRNEVCQ